MYAENPLKQKENKSIFSIGDYRHNIFSKEEADLYAKKVSKLPKNFFGGGKVTETK
jgi:hypothetical protein